MTYFFGFFGIFIGIIGGTPEKRIFECLFCPLCSIFVCFYRHYRGAERVIISFRGFRRIPTDLVGTSDNIIPRIPSDSDGIGRNG